MEKTCPYCGKETRPGDNFCLNCGNRLLPATPSSPTQQAQPAVSEATLAAPDDWAASLTAGTVSNNWSPDVGLSTVAEPGFAPTAQATMDRIEQPARFILRSDTGEVVQEYPLDKPKIAIGRAPDSDILLSKDKLTSRRHATVHYENGEYQLRDERSANGTFVNGQQIEEMVPRTLQDGDHVGIGEHELIFRAFGSTASNVEDMPTVAVSFDSPPPEMTYRTRDDEMATMASSSDDEFATRSEVEPEAPPPPAQAYSEPVAPPVSAPVMPETPQPTQQPEPVASVAPAPPPAVESVSKLTSSYVPPSTPAESDANVTLSRLTNLEQPSLPDMTPLIAALSALDGQITSLQEQFNATQESMRSHEAEIAQTTNQLRTGMRRVAERMDKTIADVARSREALAWAELLQLMDDVMNNPRDIEYVTKLARKARDLNKVFQIHQSVLNTMAECNSLLRGMIGEDR
ncbi:MAG: FHA domain-containing protein [Chloroflexi bacterium]|nr:FHA domain-containing protein [Chloroflexota bacterium]